MWHVIHVGYVYALLALFSLNSFLIHISPFQKSLLGLFLSCVELNLPGSVGRTQGEADLKRSASLALPVQASISLWAILVGKTGLS